MKKNKLLKMSKLEKRLLIASIIVAIVSLLLQCIVCRTTKKNICDSEISNMVVTAQAEIITLVIAVLALITKTRGKYYRGIEINNYMLNTKPRVIKYYVVVFSSLAFVTVNILFDVLGLNFLLFGLFVINMIIISFTIWNTLVAFFKTNENEKMICSHIENEILNREGEKRHNYLRDFFYSLKEETLSEDSRKELHTFFFDQIFDVFFTSRESEDRKTLELMCNDYLEYLKQTDRNGTFLAFMKICYEHVRSILNRNKGELAGATFSIFSNNGKNIYDCLNEKSEENIKDSIDWNGLLNDIAYSSVLLDDKEEQRTLPYLCEELGRLYSNGDVKSNQHMLGRVLDAIEMVRYSQNYNDQQKELLIKLRSRCLLRMAKAVVCNNQLNIIEKELYKKTRDYLGHNSDRIVEEGFAFLFIELHIFIYYAAFYESKSIIKEEVREKCKDFLYKEEIKYAFNIVLEQLVFKDRNVIETNNLDNIDILNKEFFENVYAELDPLDIMVEGVKTYVMENAVDDFTVFLFTYIVDNYAKENLFDNCFDKSKGATYYYLRFRDDWVDKYREFYNIVTLNSFKEQENEERVLAGYSKLIKKIKENYKRATIEKARRKERKLDKIKDVEKSEIEKKLKEYLNAKLLVKSKKSENDFVSRGEKLIQINTFADMILESQVDHTLRFMDGNLAAVLYRMLVGESKIEKINMRQMDKDAYLHFLENKKGNLFFGSSHKYGYDNKYYDEDVENILKSQTRCLEDANTALILDNCDCLRVDDVSISIRKETLDDLDVEIDEETNLYEYYVSENSSVELTKEELEEYLNNTRRIIEVRIVLRVSRNCMGIVLVDD